MATTTQQMVTVDPRGDVLLCFPGRAQQKQPQQLLQLEEHSMSENDSHPSDTSTLFDQPSHRGPNPNGPGSGDQEPSAADTVCLRVSSSVLSLASPVFSAMLSGPMAEGVAFRAPSEPRPFPLTLPEDDGLAFSILAHVIHFRPESVPYLPTTAALLALAFLVDKYDCAPALMCYGEIWLNRAIEQREDPQYAAFERRCDLMLFAYVLDLPLPFAQLSWDVILNHRQQLKGETEFGLDLPIPEDHELLRHDLHGEIAKRKARVRREVHAALMEPINNVTAQLAFYNSPGPHQLDPAVKSTTCPNAALAMGNYMALLDFHNLSPWRPQYETDSFSSIIARAHDVALQASDNPGLKFEMCRRSRCACGAMAYGDGVHLAQKLAWTLGSALKWKLWACLDCLKNGREQKGNCRVKHW